MSDRQSGLILRQFRTLFGQGTLVGMSEDRLLDRFVMHRDEAAFEAIVARHGPMVLGVCRRVLDDPEDIEDAFQATFLVLVRKAGSLRNRDLLANWLYGVAHRVAVRARANTYRRRLRERPGCEEAAMAGESRDDLAELRAVLDDEMSHLPDRLRAVVVLCDLEGVPQEDVARQLGCPVGTIKSRLSRARARLRGRLVRRGIAPSCLPAGTLIAPETASVAVPAALSAATIRAGLGFAAGAAISAPIAALVGDVVRSMTMTKVYVAATGLLASILAVVGTLAITATMAHDDPPPVAAPVPLPTPATLRRALKTWWDGIETLEFREVESPADKIGRPVQSGRRAVVEVALGRGDRRAVMHGTLEPDGHVRVAQEKRDNGHTQIYLMSNAETPDKITDVRITKQTNTRDAYRDEMGTVLWLLTPWTSGAGGAAQPLYQHLENTNTSTKVEIGRDANGKPTVTLTLAYEGQRYELDPDHDYLPKWVTGHLQDISVTRFAKVNGRWFPVEGLITHNAREVYTLKAGELADTGLRTKERRGAFVVTGLRINQPIPDPRFEKPPDLDKVRVMDFTQGERGSRPVDH
jgi:RNA polymerase sigma factor (sigma-70 family)